MDTEKALECFSKTRILATLDDEGRRRLLEAAQLVTFEHGARVVKEGDPGDALYLIVGGRATVSVDDYGKDKTVAQLSEGDVFGEMSVIAREPRSATVVAHGGDLSVLRVAADAVREVLDDYPEAWETMGRLGIARTEDTMKKLLDI